MVIKGKPVAVYDIEIFPNCFHCTVKDTETNDIYKFEISCRKNQLVDLVGFFVNANSKYLICGYNNHHYDDVIINYLIDYCERMKNMHYLRICDSLFNLSQTIVNSEDGDINKFKRWKYAHYFYSMDILTMLYSKKLRVGLKSMQVTMHYYNVQEYEGDFEKPIPESDIDAMIGYNINDVDSTATLLERCKSDVDLRLFIEKEYGIDALSMDGVKFGETLLLKKYCEQTGLSPSVVKQMRSPMDWIPLKDVILPIIKFKNPKFQAILEDMKKQVVSSKERKGYEKKFVISGTCYSIGVGGIHSINTPRIYKPKDDELIYHSDVTSMYPSLLITKGFVPRHLGKEFLATYTDIYHERVEAKHNGEKLKNLALKLTLNSVTGKMQQETSWMYDPFSVFKIRINGQLVLLMLVDRLIDLGCEIIQVNTDGVVYTAKKNVMDRVQDAIHDVEQITELTFENDSYEAFYQYAINDYFGVIEGYSATRNPKLIEHKGMFITETTLGKGLAPVVIPKAVINYFLTGENISDFIKLQTDIKDFLIGQRVDKKFTVEHGNKKVSRINRYYASTNGCYLYKVDYEKDPPKYTNMLTKSGVTLLNTFDNVPIADRKINYQYYISEARKIVNDFVCQQSSLFD